MVFESLVAELVNRYLGDFVENLDASQLKLGIWGGDVVLNNLFVKESALDDLDLPVKILHGNLGKLTLKIPWKNLYSEPTVANLEGLYVVAVPNMGVKYNAEKEDKTAWEKKQKELDRIEEAKKQQAMKGKKDVKADSFAEKMATNVIKNLQVTVSDIHVRYEDKYTNPKNPVAIGVTLKGLDFQTTDENWKPKVIKEATHLIHKMIKLNSLSVYWNSKTQSYMDLQRPQTMELLRENIACPGKHTDYQYLIEPICSSAQLRLHTKPEENDYNLPKLFLNVILQEIAVGLYKNQFQDVLELLESFERLSLAGTFRKHNRPTSAIKGNASQWWHFAYRCILEETVRRRRKMWSWENIKKHRDILKEYKQAYKKKLAGKKVSGDLKKTLESCEKQLSVLNVTLVRQQAEIEAKKEGLKKEKSSGGGGWFGGWFGGGKKKEQEKKEEKSVGEQFEELMTSEEKAKLYDAIGYQESAADPVLPKEYIANHVDVLLENFSVSLKDSDAKVKNLLKLQLQNMRAGVRQRPGGDALKAEVSIEQFTADGMAASEGGESAPRMITPTSDPSASSASLLKLLFETNPLDGRCDQCVNLEANPLQIAYHAETINHIAEFFKPPESVHLKQLQSAAFEKLEEIKEQTATGLQHAVENRKYSEISVDIKPSCLIIPDKGLLRSDAKLIVVQLGHLTVNTEKPDRTPVSPGAHEQLSMDELIQKAYDKFCVSLDSVQCLMAQPGEDWKSACNSGNTPMHILRPMGVKLDICKSMVEDRNLAKIKVQGELPKLQIDISDHRIIELLQLVNSIPFPESAPEAGPPPEIEDVLAVENIAKEGDADRLIRTLATEDSSDDESGGEGSAPKEKKLERATSREFANLTNVELKFEIKEVCLTLSQRKGQQDVPILKLVVDTLGTQVAARTFDLSAEAYVGGIYLQHMQFKATNDGPLVNLINTPITDDSTFKLLTVSFLKADRKGPEFATQYNNTEQKIKVAFSALEVLLHQEAILNLMQFGQSLQAALAPPPGAATPAAPAPAPTATPAITASTGDTGATAAKIARRKKKTDEIIQLSLEAKLDVFAVAVCTQTAMITDVKIKGLEVGVNMQKSKIGVEAILKDITVYDPTPQALYPKILAFEGGDVFAANIVIYNGATDGEDYSDMKCVDTAVSLKTGCMKVVFLNKFVTSLLNFLNNFQAAKDRMSEASAAVAESAAAAAQDFNQKAPRVSLNVELKAPIVIMPQNSTSNNALVIDLGHLAVSNSFSVGSKVDSEGRPAVLDNMTVKLTSLKLSRALMLGTDMTAECLLLEPVSIQIDIMRNLSAGWYHEHPDIDISGNLSSFSVCLSHGDFTTAMGVVLDNLAEQPPSSGKEGVEGAPTTAVAASTAQATPGQQVATTSAAAKPPGAASSQKVTTTAELPAAVEAWVKMKFNFTINSIKATLYVGDSNLSTGVSEREAKFSLAQFELQQLSAKGAIKSDTAISAHVAMNNCILNDTRPGNAVITRMLERKGAANLPDNMIDLKFEQKANQDKDITLEIKKLYICVCLEYLMTVGDFFTKGLPQPKPAAAPAAPAPATGPTPEAAPPAPVPEKPASEPPAGEISIKLSVEDPEIVMVENALSIDTNALLLSTQVLLRMRISPENQSMQGHIQGFNIVSCVFNPEKRDKTKAMIWNPMDVAIHMNAPQGKHHHIDIIVTDIVMNISPSTIRTLTATFSNMKPAEVEGEKSIFDSIPTDLWKVKKLQEFDFWFLQAAVPDKTSELPGSSVDESEEDLEERGEQLMVSVNSIEIKIEGDIGHRTVPFLITEMTFQAEVRDWSSKLNVGCDISMQVGYYNEGLAVWEPLIEPCEDENKHRPWEIKVQMCQNELLPPVDEEENDVPALPQPKMTIAVSSRDILQITMTKSCLDVLTKLGKSFGDAYNLVEVTEKVSEVLPPVLVKNESGLHIQLKLDDTFKIPAKAKDGHMELGPGDNLRLEDAAKEELRIVRKSTIKDTQEQNMRKLYLVLEEFGCTRELKIMRAEKCAYGINQRAYPGGVWHLICQTEAFYGSKAVTLRSMVQVKNHLPFGVELYYKLSDDAKGRCGEVLPEKTYNVPLEAVYAAPYELFFKPQDPKYGESKDPFMWKEQKAGYKGVVCCQPTKAGSPPIYFNVKIEVEDIWFESKGEKSAKSYILHLHPCAVFRNLLPYPVSYTLEGSEETVTVGPGENKPTLNANLGQTVMEIRLKYQDKDWTGRRMLESKPDELTIWSFEAVDGSGTTTMDLGLHTRRGLGYHLLSLYCPYWMLNKTGRSLSYKKPSVKEKGSVKEKSSKDKNKQATDENTTAHPPEMKDILLFAFKGKAFFGKKKEEIEDHRDRSRSPSPKGSLLCSSSPRKRKSSADVNKPRPRTPPKKSIKASLKVADSEWSDKFSLDTVGSAGTVSCKFKGYNFEVVGSPLSQSAMIGLSLGGVDEGHAPTPSPDKHKSVKVKVGVNITLASSGLTKVIVFTPYYLLINQAPFVISVKENFQDAHWCDLSPNECTPYWPVQQGKKLQMVAKVKDTSEETIPFYFNDTHTTLLQLNNQYAGIHVETQIMESAVQLTFQQYKVGTEAVRIINHTVGATVKYMQKLDKDLKDKSKQQELGPGETVVYTWTDPLAKRELYWTCGQKADQKNDLVKDGIGDFFFDADTKLYWVSFLDGMQRVLLFTEDLVLATKAQQAGELERVEQEILVSLQGMGLSLVNNPIKKEVAYISITSSGVVWEEKKKKRFKALKVKSSNILEQAYEQYAMDCALGKQPSSRKQLEAKVEVDFGTEPMTMIKPRKCVIQRRFENGIWLQYRTSPHQLQLHVKLHRLQLDNQLPGAVFPTVLAPIPPPKSVAAESVPKPFTEISVMVRKRDYSKVMQIKYCKMLIQEMSVKVDQIFLNALMALFASGEEDDAERKKRFDEDCKVVDSQLMDYAIKSSSDEQKNFYDELHFSPLKVHLSFSMYSGGEEKKAQQLSNNVFSLFLQSVGIVLTDIQDVIFKLGFFERKYSFYNQSQLVGEIGRHYSQQAIKQAYVLVLGLDVLGNPFGLVRGLAEGIEDLFYEPYQGAIQGPEEFAEGLALGVRSLFGHAIGGTAGAVSRITGALGKGIATLTLDEEYQRKRREQMNKRPADFKEGIARGGKGLVMGVVDGVTGIVKKPVQGAKQEGAAGFVKGMGKGLVGVFTRPASGVVDFASSSFEGIKRATELTDEVRRLRPPRFLHGDGIVRPFIYREAEGNDTLLDVEKGKYASDVYTAHVIVTKDRKNVLLVTDTRVLFASKGEIFGHWDCDWQYTWEELKEAPTATPKGEIQILLKEKQKKSFFRSGAVGKLIPMQDKKTADWLVEKIKDAMSKQK